MIFLSTKVKLDGSNFIAVDYFTGKGKELNIRMFKVAERDLVISCFIHSMQPEVISY